MKNVPKIEKKHLIAGGALTAVALIAFFAGTGTRKIPAHEKEMKVAVAKPAHEPSEGSPSVATTPDRAPASIPTNDAPSDEENYQEEEEIDTQIASRIPHGDAVVETSSAPVMKEDPRGIITRLIDTYVDAWESANAKVHAIQQTEEENKKLKLENAYLRVMVETGKFTARSEEAMKKTKTVGKKLATAAGSRAARSLASIRYQYPENLLPEQLLTLGVSYFKIKDDEKAAVILNFLTELDDDKSFRTAANYLMAGISFYRLEHYKYASEYFDRVAKLTETDPESLKAKRQVPYWQALVAERLKNRRLAQKLILESLEKDPLTKEARWVNPQGVAQKKRLPASTPNEEESHEGHSQTHH